MIRDFEATLRLRWGLNAERKITVPVDIRKGSYSQRYELYIDDVHVGWVVKLDGKWESHVTADQSETGWNQITGIAMTRTEAIGWLVYKLAQNARSNVLAQRAEEAYA